MPTIVLIILIIIIFAFVLLAGLLFIPFRYKITGNLRGSSVGARLHLKAFGCLGFSLLYKEGTWMLHFSVFQATLPFVFPWQRRGKLKEKGGEGDKEKGKFSFQEFVRYARHIADREMLAGFWDLVKNLFRIFKIHSFKIQGKVGFYEPHLTGQLAAFLYSVKSACRNYSSDLELVWDEEVLDLEVKAEGKVLFAAVIFYLLRFLLSKNTRRVWKKIKKEKKVSRLAAI